MEEIEVQPVGEEGGRSRFTVTVREGDSTTTHDVTVTDGDYRRLGERYDAYRDFVHASFEFLLQREPKESILPRFDVADIPRYFPEFEREIAGEDA
jgi:hypothetical protein